MVWAGFGYSGKTEIVRVGTHMKAVHYQKMLSEYLLPVGASIGGQTWKFQQDNAGIHTAHSTIAWFQDNAIEAINWPSLSPDMNPIENLWGVLVRKVFHGGRQFENANHLKIAIRAAWHDIDVSILRNLVESMPKRVFELIRANGGPTKY